jgi:hypothetical protein
MIYIFFSRGCCVVEPYPARRNPRLMLEALLELAAYK